MHSQFFFASLFVGLVVAFNEAPVPVVPAVTEPAGPTPGPVTPEESEMFTSSTEYTEPRNLEPTPLIRARKECPPNSCVPITMCTSPYAFDIHGCTKCLDFCDDLEPLRPEPTTREECIARQRCNSDSLSLHDRQVCEAVCDAWLEETRATISDEHDLYDRVDDDDDEFQLEAEPFSYLPITSTVSSVVRLAPKPLGDDEYERYDYSDNESWLESTKPASETSTYLPMTVTVSSVVKAVPTQLGDDETERFDYIDNESWLESMKPTPKSINNIPMTSTVTSDIRLAPTPLGDDEIEWFEDDRSKLHFVPTSDEVTPRPEWDEYDDEYPVTDDAIKSQGSMVDARVKPFDDDASVDFEPRDPIPVSVDGKKPLPLVDSLPPMSLVDLSDPKAVVESDSKAAIDDGELDRSMTKMTHEPSTVDEAKLSSCAPVRCVPIAACAPVRSETGSRDCFECPMFCENNFEVGYKPRHVMECFVRQKCDEFEEKYVPYCEAICHVWVRELRPTPLWFDFDSVHRPTTLVSEYGEATTRPHHAVPAVVKATTAATVKANLMSSFDSRKQPIIKHQDDRPTVTKTVYVHVTATPVIDDDYQQHVTSVVVAATSNIEALTLSATTTETEKPVRTSNYDFENEEELDEDKRVKKAQQCFLRHCMNVKRTEILPCLAECKNMAGLEN